MVTLSKEAKQYERTILRSKHKPKHKTQAPVQQKLSRKTREHQIYIKKHEKKRPPPYKLGEKL